MGAQGRRERDSKRVRDGPSGARRERGGALDLGRGARTGPGRLAPGRVDARDAAAHVDAILTGHIHDAFAHPIEGVRRPMVQMGAGTLSTRLRATRPSFCVISLDGEHMVQEIVTIDRNGLEISRNYNSLESEAGTQLQQVR